MNPPIDWPGETPWETIAAAYDEQCPDGYAVQLVGDDAEIVTAAVNQGIDSRLEAISFMEGGEPGWENTHPTLGFPKLCMTFDKHGLLILLRRLYEYNYGEAVDEDDERKGDLACNFRGAVLQTLNIEED
jgi:hypothetical protein